MVEPADSSLVSQIINKVFSAEDMGLLQLLRARIQVPSRDLHHNHVEEGEIEGGKPREIHIVGGLPPSILQQPGASWGRRHPSGSTMLHPSSRLGHRVLLFRVSDPGGYGKPFCQSCKKARLLSPGKLFQIIIQII